MATRADMMRMVQLLGTGLAKYALDRDWKAVDFSIYYDISSQWEKVYFVFVSSEFDVADKLSSYKSVKDYLSDLYSKDSYHDQLMHALSLVVRGQKQVEQGGLYAVGSTYKDFKPVFLNFLSETKSYSDVFQNSKPVNRT